MAQKNVKLDDIRIDGGTQTRAEINQETVNDYADAVLDGAKFPPVEIFFDGVDNWLADGFHRYHGHRKAEVKDISANVQPGTLEDALRFALGANQANGLRRTNEDKRNCVKIALAKWPEWSDRALAELCGVGNKFVGTVRSQVCLEHTSTPAPEKPKTRKGKDGKEYPAPQPKPEAEDSIVEFPQETTEPISEPETGEEPEQEETIFSGDDAPEEPAPAEGMMWADKAIRCLEKIKRNDTKRRQAAQMVSRWVVMHLE